MYITSRSSVQIDEEGVFKYVLLRRKEESSERLEVHGSATAEYHDDIVQRAKHALPAGASVSCLGGGRIRRTGGAIFVYGHSLGYPSADQAGVHAQAVAVLQAAFPSVAITFSTEGY
jgi:hypothetical protein